MADYKEMYFKLLRATEEAIRILIAAQQDCEEQYLSAPESTLKVFPGLMQREDAVTGSGDHPKRIP